MICDWRVVQGDSLVKLREMPEASVQTCITSPPYFQLRAYTDDPAEIGRETTIWEKKNPMPESVTDRPTRSHEFIFLLSKQEHYFYDFEAIKEPCSGNAHPRGHGVNPKSRSGGDHPRNVDSRYQAPGMPQHTGLRKRGLALKAGKNEADPGALSPSGQRRTVGFNDRWRVKQNESFSAAVTEVVEKRNKRDVWIVGSQPTSDEHYAAFPELLVLPCVLAGAPAGGTVLDPFCGTATVGAVAAKNGRNFVGVELSHKYVEIAERRLSQATPLFARRAVP